MVISLPLFDAPTGMKQDYSDRITRLIFSPFNTTAVNVLPKGFRKVYFELNNIELKRRGPSPAQRIEN